MVRHLFWMKRLACGRCLHTGILIQQWLKCGGWVVKSWRLFRLSFGIDRWSTTCVIIFCHSMHRNQDNVATIEICIGIWCNHYQWQDCEARHSDSWRRSDRVCFSISSATSFRLFHRNVVHRHEPPVTSRPIKILHHDVERQFIVIDKPGSIVCSPVAPYISI